MAPREEAATQGLEPILREHDLFKELDPQFVALMVECSVELQFEAGTYLFRERGEADRLHLLREGRVALEAASPQAGPLVVQTLAPGEIVGVSWLVAPYRWAYDARALEATRTIGVDAHCLRGRLDQDPALGYAVLKRFVPALIQRLQGTRLQMLDVYANPRAQGTER